eukprot:2220410-Prymnesium_polylepis.1
MSIGAGRPSSSPRARRRVAAFVRRPQKNPQHNFQMRSLRFCGLCGTAVSAVLRSAISGNQPHCL